MKLPRSFFATGLVLALTLGTTLFAAGAPKPPAKKPPAQPAKPKTSPQDQPEEPAPAKPVESDTPQTPDAALPAANGEILYFRDFADAKALVEQLPKAMATGRLTAHLTVLSTTYLNTVTGVALSADKKQLFLVAAGGGRFLYDDGRAKDHEQLLSAADVEDMFLDNYPLTNPADRLPLDFDPGRARPEALFKALYGASPEAVKKNLVQVTFAGKKVLFSRLHGASAALEKVDRELAPLLAAKPELRKWTTSLGGTFNWRKIEGTDRLSTHSYGIALDLNAEKAKYWRWEKPSTLTSFSRKDFPVEIIEIFERHGFVWGGKWYHYDTMHFEYRPEIIAAARLTGDLPPAFVPVPVPGVTPAPGRETPDSPPVSRTRRALLIETPGPAAKTDGLVRLRTSLSLSGFSVEVLKSPDLSHLLESVERLAAAPAGTEVILLHFSGEAMYRGNKTFLIPSKAAIKSPEDLFAEAVPLDRVIEALKKTATPVKIVLLDTPPASSANGQESPGQQFMVPGFFFGFAGSSSAVGSRGWQPGIFTKSLATQMVTPRLSLGDMFTMVTQEVNRDSGGTQKPQSFSSLSEIFRFSELPKNSPALPAPASPGTSKLSPPETPVTPDPVRKSSAGGE